MSLLRNGDIIEIDIRARKLAVKLSATELAKRKKIWRTPKPRFRSGWLARYAQMATSASTGAVLRQPE